MTDPEKNIGSLPDRILKTMWHNWLIGISAITLPMVFSLFLNKTWLPFIAFFEVYILMTLLKSNLIKGLDSCALFIRLSARILFLSAVVMLGINILCTDFFIPTVVHLELYNSEIPFIVCLITFPVTAIVCAYALFADSHNGACRRCHRIHGHYAGDSIVGTLYRREVRYQLSILMLVSISLGAVEYWYYFARYINTDFNAPDQFFFVFMPIAVFLLSLLVMGGRYASLSTLYSVVKEASPARTNTTTVRYLILCANELLLNQGADGRWDTMAETVINRVEGMSDEEARRIFEQLYATDNFQLRYCFTNDGFATGSNMLHYAVFLSGEPSDVTSNGAWFNAYMLDCSLQAGALSPILANELYRIHTITMAWKTYYPNGKRRYPIKHYRPTFRLGDLKEWTVDYDDLDWFSVAHNNEDSSFFRIRNFWGRITGFLAPKRSEQ